MSDAFDTLGSVWRKRIEPHVRDKTLAFLFETVIEEMHLANHTIPDPTGVFKGDGINKVPRVTRAARELEGHTRELDAAEEQAEAARRARAERAFIGVRCPKCSAGYRLVPRFFIHPEAVHLCPVCKVNLIGDSTVFLTYTEAKAQGGEFARVLPDGVRRVGEGIKARYESDDPRLLE